LRNRSHGGQHKRPGSSGEAMEPESGAKKAAGARLGNRTNLAEAGKAGAGSNKREADAFAANVLPVISSLMASGITSHRGIATALNECRIEAARGGAWTAVQVGRIMNRTA
jgi:hypothetical protein